MEIELQIENKPGQVGKIGQLLGGMNVNIRNIELKESTGDIIRMVLSLKLPTSEDKARILARIKEEDDIYVVEEI